MTKFKGPAFPSFLDQKEPAPRQQWISHNGKKQRVKNLRIVCRPVLSSSDPMVIEAIARARELVSGQFEEHGVLMIIHQAMEVSDDTGVDFVEALDYIVDKMKLSLTAEQEKKDVPSE